jgi:hypothetical protein
MGGNSRFPRFFVVVHQHELREEVEQFMLAAGKGRSGLGRI